MAFYKQVELPRVKRHLAANPASRHRSSNLRKKDSSRSRIAVHRDAVRETCHTLSSSAWAWAAWTQGPASWPPRLPECVVLGDKGRAIASHCMIAPRLSTVDSMNDRRGLPRSGSSPHHHRAPRHFFRADGPMPAAVTLALVLPPELGDATELRQILRGAGRGHRAARRGGARLRRPARPRSTCRPPAVMA